MVLGLFLKCFLNFISYLKHNLGRGSMYKDAGVMGGKIKSTLTSNPMMTSPAGFNPSGGMAGHFQPAAFQPGTDTRSRLGFMRDFCRG